MMCDHYFLVGLILGVVAGAFLVYIFTYLLDDASGRGQ